MAPRGLKEPVIWRDSSFSQALRPVLDSHWERSRGGRLTKSRIRSAACLTDSSCIGFFFDLKRSWRGGLRTRRAGAEQVGVVASGAVSCDLLVQEKLGYQAVTGHTGFSGDKGDLTIGEYAVPEPDFSNAAPEEAVEVPCTDSHRGVTGGRGDPQGGIIVVAFRVASAGILIASLKDPVFIDIGSLGVSDSGNVNPIT